CLANKIRMPRPQKEHFPAGQRQGIEIFEQPEEEQCRRRRAYNPTPRDFSQRQGQVPECCAEAFCRWRDGHASVVSCQSSVASTQSSQLATGNWQPATAFRHFTTRFTILPGT